MYLFNNVIDWPIVSEQLRWEGKLVLRDRAGSPNIFFRLKLTGTFFVERSSEPFMQVGGLRSRFVRIASDGLSADGYFDQPPPAEGAVEFGYTRQVYLRCATSFERGRIVRLKRDLLPDRVANLDRFAEGLEGPPPL